MANRPSKSKRKIGYAEYRAVFSIIEEIAAQRGCPASEVIREAVLQRANQELIKTGRKPLNLDPSPDACVQPHFRDSNYTPAPKPKPAPPQPAPQPQHKEPPAPTNHTAPKKKSQGGKPPTSLPTSGFLTYEQPD